MICAYCNSRVLPADRKCPSCGSTVFVPDEQKRAAATAVPVEEPKVVYQTIHHNIYVEERRSRHNRWIALAFCLLGGMLGLHRFYTGKVGTGVLYLFTGGLFGCGVIADFFSILFGYFRDKQGLKLAG